MAPAGDRLEVRLPHVGADEAEMGAALAAEGAEEFEQRLGPTFAARPEQTPGTLVDLVDDREEPIALCHDTSSMPIASTSSESRCSRPHVTAISTELLLCWLLKRITPSNRAVFCSDVIKSVLANGAGRAATRERPNTRQLGLEHIKEMVRMQRFYFVQPTKEPLRDRGKPDSLTARSHLREA